MLPKIALVADDQPIMRQLLTRILTRTDWTVVVAVDGNQALTVLDESNRWPSLIITDVEMPHMDGIQLIDHLRESEYRGIPIIAMSGHLDLYETQLTARGVPALHKPFHLRELQRVIQEIFLGNPTEAHHSPLSPVLAG